MTNSPTGLLGASAAGQMHVMDDPGAQQPSQMFLDLGKGQTTTLGTLCPANGLEVGQAIFSRQ